MQETIAERLTRLNIELPEPSQPGATYVPFIRTGNLVFITGQLSQWNGERRFIGKLGGEFDVAEGQQAARLCALNVLSQLRVAVNGDRASDSVRPPRGLCKLDAGVLRPIPGP